MIIKVVPETDIEKAQLKEMEHHNVKEFFMFGNKKDTDGQLVDFHDWTGSYRYLIGSVFNFLDILRNERKIKDEQARSAAAMGPRQTAPTAPQMPQLPQELPQPPQAPQPPQSPQAPGNVIEFNPNNTQPIEDPEREEEAAAEEISKEPSAGAEDVVEEQGDKQTIHVNTEDFKKK